MTSTPIPRTLYMSLSGVRDMSVIETPPVDRLPIETVVRRFNRAAIKEALERELERGGQVFFVHNRVQSLPSMVRFIQELVPDARVIMAHGQMKERELEAAMVKFIDGQADILVSTAIVESGLDIPSSNTMIINRADRFGLAQLYQLRGRVGRERLQAFCYLLVPADGRVDDEAQRRLRALQELTELGSGFKLALRDLDAGRAAGARQGDPVEPRPSQAQPRVHGAGGDRARWLGRRTRLAPRRAEELRPAMTLRSLGVGAAALLVAGCAMPSMPTMPGWVPWVDRKAEPPPPVAAASTTPKANLVDSPKPGDVRQRPTEDPDDVADRIVAVVNNDAITMNELLEKIAVYHMENRQPGGPTDEQLKQESLNRLIDDRLQLQEADREKIAVEDAELNEEFLDRIKKYGVTSEEEFDKLVRAQGVTLESVKRRLRDGLKVSKLIRRKVTLRVAVTEG